MEEKNGTMFTIGQFAKKSGVTQRTIRFYDKIGLLKPSYRSGSNRRLYNIQDFARLQKILTLKFIGLSLDDISNVLKYDLNDNDFKKSLEIQRDIIDKKIYHMHMVKSAIDETLNMLDKDNILNWEKFINIINVINSDKNWMEQYQNASNLRARIRIHELYSTNKYGWMRWFFEQMDIPEDARILELGCGDASLWVKNIDRIPEGWDITLTDFSRGMLKDAQKALKGNSPDFNFNVVDAQSIPYADESFDVVIANHMLYHVHDIDRALSEIYRVLKNEGNFFASTVGKNHMKEMKDIAETLVPDIKVLKSFEHTERFQLENGMEMINKFFKDAELKRYEDSLIVGEPGPIIDYIFSISGRIRRILTGEKLKNLYDFLANEIKRTGGIHITKDTGFFHARKYINQTKGGSI
ncbi:MAG: methyltransferase domain-containing protein [Clostridiales bacterium]|nr:methyltransferase domain-containing protein [Clostridiales bacterium]